MGPADLKVGDIIHDKASGKFGKITSKDGSGDFEMTEMTNEEVISELKNPPGDIDIQIPMTPEQIAKIDSQDATGGESDMIDIIDKIDVKDL